jgi:CsoR family transcriptional regulator, copper-sensing transcriptional repressor
MMNSSQATAASSSVNRRAARSCGACVTEDATLHPDHSKILPRLKRAQGQISGVERMIEERRYCVDILIQLRAVRAALDAVEAKVLENHLRGCVKEALESKSPKASERKIEELVSLFLRQS